MAAGAGDSAAPRSRKWGGLETRPFAHDRIAYLKNRTVARKGKRAVAPAREASHFVSGRIFHALETRTMLFAAVKRPVPVRD